MFLWVVVESPSQDISAFTLSDRYTHVCVMRWQAVEDEEAGPPGRGAVEQACGQKAHVPQTDGASRCLPVQPSRRRRSVSVR